MVAARIGPEFGLSLGCESNRFVGVDVFFAMKTCNGNKRCWQFFFGGEGHSKRFGHSIAAFLAAPSDQAPATFPRKDWLGGRDSLALDGKFERCQ